MNGLPRQNEISERRLLILDDDPLVGRTMTTIASSIAVESRFTTDPTEFFTYVDEWKPTHIALDLVMPKMDGVQVMAELSELGCEAKIIITSGQGTRVLDAAGRSGAWRGLSVLAVLAKPFSVSAFRELLSRDTRTDGMKAKKSKGPLDLTRQGLETALRNQEFHLVYQPKVDCKTETLKGFEALVRWLSPEHGLVSPDNFIPLLEKWSLIDQLTELVLDMALRWFSPLSTQSQDKLSLSINISNKTLENTKLIESLADRCKEVSVEPGQLVFEITETSAMEDPVASLSLLTRLRLKGFHLSIDDFGTGYSSMLQLVRLPFSEIKVDKSFVMTARTSEEHRSVIKSVVNLGHSLGLWCTAEGLEDAETLKYLKQIGCDAVQGYHIARPMTEDAVKEWMNKYGAPL